jgi:hypothetical protein
MHALLALAALLLASAGGPVQGPQRAGPLPAKANDADPCAAFADLARACAASAASDGACERALGQLLGQPSRAVRACIAGVASRSPSEPERRAGLAVLERIGTAEEVPLVLRLGAPGLEPQLRLCLAGLLRRDGRGLTRLEPEFERAGSATRSVILAAVEDLRSVEGAAWLSRSIERGRGPRSETLSRLGRMAQGLRGELPEELGASVRAVLSGSDFRARRDAIVAAGRMRDSHAVAQLIELLEDSDPGAREDAAWSLERITRLRFGQQPERWRAWHAAEREWWSQHSSDVFALLRGQDRRARLVSLVDIARLNLHRERLASEVVFLLEDEDVATATVAARVLGRLEADNVLGQLVAALRREEPDVVQAAWHALRRITGKDLPAEPEAWNQVLGA